MHVEIHGKESARLKSIVGADSGLSIRIGLELFGMAFEKDIFNEVCTLRCQCVESLTIGSKLLQTLETRTQELAYEEACRQLEMVCQEEKQRQLRTQILVSVDERDDWQSQLVQKDDCIIHLQRSNQRLQAELGNAISNHETAQRELRITSREIETMKVGQGAHRVLMRR